MHCFVLQISVVMLDILHMLVAKNAVVICKFNPILDFLAPFVEYALFTAFESAFLLSFNTYRIRKQGV